MKNIDAILFDLDGTITDTEKFYQAAWPEALEHFGYQASRETILQFRSLGRPFAAMKFRELFGEDCDYYTIRAYRKNIINEAMDREGIDLKPGAEELLKWLRKTGITVALVTAQVAERGKMTLDRVGLTKYFDRIIGADMVEKGKPCPDCYLYACRELGLKPERTIAVEDSPNGVRSAHDAGCRVIMVPDLTEPDEELEKLLYAKVKSLEEIISLIEKSEGVK